MLQVMYKMAREMIKKMVLEYNLMIPADSMRDTKPMSKVVESYLMAKYAQKMPNLTAEVVVSSMAPMLMNVTLALEHFAQ